ncbi:transglutaminaseTgpA domain-containing protein [Actomonas aquatica]|uniref:TransglutaminaseTgpA domain-containing protein n=1 Tax=Actomonas aquatica TaxID=2866162 RepID=A0ABZ1C7F2_9BACT|nr:transglutaminaseTgpA domain-containing protein [Opitutus sp. WL0086]WRQ87391.1 transglutaminaseTgpA domain-containing protein [Opitutus sp. WL0086]
MVKRRPQLNPEDLGRLRWGLGAILALLSVVTVFFMEIDAWLMMPAVTLAALAAIVWPTWPARLPALIHRLAFPGILLAFVADLTLSRDYLPALIRLDLMLIFYRLITYRQRRDDLQLVVLGLFLIIVAGVITVSLSFAVQLIAFTGCALVMLLAVTLEHADGLSPQPIAPGVTPAWARGDWRSYFGKWRAATDWRLAALGIAGFAAMVVISGLLFLAIPRFELQNSLFIDRLISRTTRTGFSENIRFGEVTEITQDNGLAFSVDVSDPSTMPVAPYWRMVVLDEYTGEGFKMSDELRRDLNGYRPLSRQLQGRGKPNPGSPTWTVYMETGVSRFLPLLGNFYSMRFTEPQTFSLSEELRVVALQRDPPKMFAFEVWSMDTSAELLDASFALQRRNGDARGGRFLGRPETPGAQSRLRRLLNQIPVSADADAATFGQAVVNFLGGRHAYALSSAIPGGDGDPLVRWLESETPGHCEFFAGAFVLLARDAGFPARLVTGFRGGSWNDFSGSFAVRNANAHAWCEIFDDASGKWLRFDPTPGHEALTAAAEQDPETAAALAASRRDRDWRAWMESLRVFWYRRIVDFDLDTQEQILSSTKRFFTEARDLTVKWADARAEAVRDWLRRPWDVRRWGLIGGTVFGLAALVWLWRQHGQRWWYRLNRASVRRGRRRVDPVRQQASRWLNKARRRADFAWPEPVLADLQRLRYGAPDSWPDPVRVFRAARQALRSA